MKKVICFYWQGDRWQETPSLPSDVSFQRHLTRVGMVSKDLASRYINNLYAGVKRFTKSRFDFICFTNEKLSLDKAIETRPFTLITTKGVLPRMYMFSEQAGLFGNQILCLDIDVIITGSVDSLLNYNGTFCTRKSWTRGEEDLLDGDIMSFKAGEETQKLFWQPLLDNFPEANKHSQGGRERFWVRHVMEGKQADTWQDILPGQVCSYKFHVMKQGRVPEGAKIISCHGYPRPHQIEQKWRKEFWN